MAPDPRPSSAFARGTAAARAAFASGLLYAAVSAYWGLGGTGLLDTIGGTLEREGRSGATSVRLLVWTAVLLKVIAALLGLVAVVRQRWMRDRWRRLTRRGAWVVAFILAGYGGLLTAGGLLVQLDLVRASPTADRTALRWHAFLWDPWFLAWGLLLTVALVRSRASTEARGADTAACGATSGSAQPTPCG
jgi:Protein of unknown function (DUF3995)